MKRELTKEYWFDIATPYGDPCDYISVGKPHEHPSATNIHVIEYSEYERLLKSLIKIADMTKPDLNDARIAAEDALDE